MSSHLNAEAVLIVDRDPAIRNLIQSLLEREGYSTLVAGSANEVRSVFSQYGKRVVLLIADMDVPGADCPELVKALRRLKPDLQVICMAASAEVSGESLEGFIILPKPFTIRELSDRVRDALPNK